MLRGKNAQVRQTRVLLSPCAYCALGFVYLRSTPSALFSCLGNCNAKHRKLSAAPSGNVVGPACVIGRLILGYAATR